MPKLRDHNSLRMPLSWMEHPDSYSMTNREFREACRLMLDLWRYRQDREVRIQQHARLRRKLASIWGAACVYCGDVEAELQIEHITPRARGGTNRISNLTLSCGPCNQRKRTRTAAEFGFPEFQRHADEVRLGE
jgi:5-methylcytosine-specific restriction endonuclease McrA